MPAGLPLGSLILLLAGWLWVSGSQAAEGAAERLAQQVFAVNHFLAFRNISYGGEGDFLWLLDRSPSGNLRRFRLERHLNNDYAGDAAEQARDLAVFRSGSLRGTGILVHVYRDSRRSLGFTIWLPELGKARRFAEPNQGDAWGGSNFTYGDIYLRRPEDETHELLEPAAFAGCLGAMLLQPGEESRGIGPPPPRCDLDGKQMLRLQSRTRFSDWWYDRRIVWIDPLSHADYRSEYYRDGELVKVLDKDWRPATDQAAPVWQYWYARSPLTGQEGMAFAAAEAIRWNRDLDADLWSESRLRQLAR